MKAISRRRFLQAGAAGIAANTSISALVGCVKQGRTPLGVQLYTLRDAMAADVGQVFASLGQIGYREVEFAGYFDYSASALANLLAANSLSAPSAHIPYENMQADLAGTIEFSKELGHRYLVVPWLAESMRQTSDDYRRHAENFNTWGEQCREAGLQLCYHHHAFEFTPIEQAIPYDILLTNTDPELLAMEMDMYWMYKAAQSPHQYILNHPGRFPLWHLKDITEDGSMMEVGSGIIDFPALFKERKQAGVKHAFVEHDQPDDAFSSVEVSFDFLVDKWH